MTQQSRFNVPQAMQEALSLHQQGRLREAEKLYGRVLKAVPNQFDALHLLGLIKAQAGQMGEAYRLMTAALKINPKVPDALMNLANVLHALKRDDEALACIERALVLRPDDMDALQKRGSALFALRRSGEALDCFERVLARHPDHFEALLNRGTVLAALGRHQAALADFAAVLASAPSHPDALYNYGTALAALDRQADAIAAFDRLLAVVPTHAKAWNNRGRALQELNRHRDAVADFAKAIAVQKDYADAHFNQALSLLTLGELRPGFEKYEWRWKQADRQTARRGFGRPMWLGEYPIAGKTVLLHAEQGLGDSIQFARYIPLLARGGTRVVLEVQSEIKPLLAGLQGVTACLARAEALPPFDVHCPLASLPLAFKTEIASIPAEGPYLQADEARIATWRARLAPIARPRIAIVWAGRATHANDRNRSIQLAQLAPLLSLRGTRFVSLQREPREADMALLAGHSNVLHIGADLDDMSDTAAVAALVDLVITVDTSVAHLAGALGRPVWIMLPFSPDWRWMLGVDNSPWYPTARLFRQPAIGEWANVVARLRDELAHFIHRDRTQELPSPTNPIGSER